jgi:3-dehydroquinate synthase
VALIGGGVSVVALIDALAHRLTTDRLDLRLAAQDLDRLEVVAQHGRHLISARPGWRLDACGTSAEAAEGASIVVLMLRVGGLEARRADELLAQRFGIPGDEGLGPGGAANALRTLPVLDALADDLRQRAPDAVVLNLVAPLGLTTRVLLERGVDAVGVCELPGVTGRALRTALGERSRLAYAGFNHLGWFWPLDVGAVAAVDPSSALASIVGAGLADQATVDRYDAVPLKYYYWLHDPAAAERLGIARDPDRSLNLIGLRDDARAELAARPEQRSPAAHARPTPWFDEALVPMIDALLGGPPWDGYANVRNGDLVPSFDADLVVEVPAQVDASGVEARPVDAEMPPAALAFSRRVERSEQLLHAAWLDEDLGQVEDSFRQGPHELDAPVARRLAHALRSATGFPATRLPHASLCRVARADPTVTTMRFATDPTTVTDYVVGRSAWRDERLLAAIDGRPVVAVIDSLVATHHRAAVDALLGDVDVLGRLELRGGEQCKTVAQLGALLDYFEACELPKHGLVLAIGGGTVSDVVGLSAMLVRRGVEFGILPTTLLSQVDAAVGGKNGIDSPTTKNIFGNFHHPLVVASDPGLLRTLDARQVVSGIAECIKVFAVADDDALNLNRPMFLRPSSATVEDWCAVVTTAQEHKLRLLADDPYEASSRRLLNYGHAFAHILEERSGYRLLHGEAVLFGMAIENEVSVELGIASKAVDDLQDLISDLVAPATHEHWVPFEGIAPELDKVRHMRRAAMNLVCIDSPGTAVIIDDLADDMLRAAWQRAEERLALSPSSTGALA